MQGMSLLVLPNLSWPFFLVVWPRALASARGQGCSGWGWQAETPFKLLDKQCRVASA